MMTTFIVLGSLFLVLLVVFYAVVIASGVSSISNDATAADAISQLNLSYTTLTNSVDSVKSAAACDQNLTCVTQQDTKAANAFMGFSTQLAMTTVPSDADADKARLAVVSATAAQDYTRLSQSTSAAQYNAAAASTNLAQTINAFDPDFNALMNKLQSDLPA
jgi:hypothetical protein